MPSDIGNDIKPVDEKVSVSSASTPTTGTKSRTQSQGVQLLSQILKSLKVAAILLVVWLIGYFEFSVSWVLIALFFYIVGQEYRKMKDTKKVYAQQAMEDEQEAILARVDELPSWVYFPDVERAEWLNKMIQQMWPFIGEYVKDLLKTTVEPTVSKNLPEKLKPFRFEKINLGQIPPRIGGVKVYIDKVKRDEVILDVEITYASDTDMTVSVRGFHAGLKDLMVHGTMRVIMRPLVNQIPIVGGLVVFFLSQPKIDFDLTDVANLLDMPLISTSLRTIVSDQIANFLVLPNKFPIKLIDSVSLSELKCPLPLGVIRLNIVEALDLKKADIGVFKSGKSDPYCKIYAQGATYKTVVIQNSVAPVWNETFEIVVDQKQGQTIEIEVLDEDPGEDDQLGIAYIDVEHLYDSTSIDAWLVLENVKHGSLHVKATWFYLSKDPTDINKVKATRGNDPHLSMGLLMVTVDSAKDLPSSKKALSEPSACVKLELGNSEQKTQVKPKTTNPRWDEKFRFLVVDPEMQELNLEVLDNNKNDKRLGVCKIALHQLLTLEDMTLSRPFALKDTESECTINLQLVLRILTPDEPNESPAVTKPASQSRDASTEQATSPSASSFAAEKRTSVAAPVAASPSADEGPSPVEGPNNRFALDSRSSSFSSSAYEQGDLDGLRYRGPIVPSDGRFGRIQVTIRYSSQRSRLVVVIHKCVNLIVCDEDNFSDPYVRLCLLPDRSSTKKKTQILKNNLNPVFDETFEWPLNKTEAASRTLELTVKNSIGYFSKNRVFMGYVYLNLSEIDDLCRAVTEWYDLQDPDEQLKSSEASHHHAA